MLARLKSWFSSKRHKVIALGVTGALICGGGIAVYVGGNPNVSPPSSINATCSSDVSTPLNAWLATLSNGAQVNFPSGACYEANETLVVPYLNNVIVNGNGSTFENTLYGNGTTTGTNNTIWEAEGGSNITFENMTVLGPNNTDYCNINGNYEWQYGIAFNDTQGGMVNNVTINQTFGDSVETQDNDNNVALGPTTGIVIENSTLENDGRMAIGITDGRNITIENNTISACGEVVDMETDTSGEYSQDVSIINNTIGWNSFGLLSMGGNAAPANSGDVTVTGNTMTYYPNTTEAAITLNSITGIVTTGFTITNNTLLTTGGNGVEVHNASNGTISNNTVALGTYQGGAPYPVNLAAYDSNITVTNNSGVKGTATNNGFGSGADWPDGAVYVDSTCYNITQSGNTAS
jgi:hypothetical protein